MSFIKLAYTCKDAWEVFANLEVLKLRDAEKERQRLQKKLEQYEYTPKDVSCSLRCESAVNANVPRHMAMTIMDQFCDENVREAEWEKIMSTGVLEAIFEDSRDLRKAIEAHLNEYYDSELFCEKQSHHVFVEVDLLANIAFKNHSDMSRQLTAGEIAHDLKRLVMLVMEAFEMKHPRYVCKDCDCQSMSSDDDVQTQVWEGGSAEGSASEEEQEL